MLSLALACDVRVGTPRAAYERRVGGAATISLPSWWLASLASHCGAMRAVQLLKRTRTTTVAELVACGLLRGVVAAEGLEAYVTGLTPTKTESVPCGDTLRLLRRILQESFSLHESEAIGCALAANSLLICEALGRLSTAPVAELPPMQPLGFELFEASATRWELRLTAELDNVAIEELISAVGGLSQKLEVQLSAGLPLPAHLLLRLNVSEAQAPPTVIPIQLLHDQQQPTNERILRWLTRWEKVLASVSKLPLTTVAHLWCDAPGGGTASLAALQLAFACDLRVASPGVRFCFRCSSLLPGTPYL
jgi:enoyl-CoA hydratase/carnithine racemase